MNSAKLASAPKSFASTLAPAPSIKSGAQVAKSFIWTPTTTSGGSVATTPSPQLLTPEQGEVNTWVWQTIDSYKATSLHEAQNTEAWMVNSNYTTKLAKEADSSLFTATDKLNMNTSLADIKFAKDKAQSDIEDFYTNPNSTIAKTFKKNVGIERYNLYTDMVNKRNSYSAWIMEDKDSAYLSSWIRGFMDLPIVSTVVDKATWGEYSAYTDAIAQKEAEGVEWLTSKWAYMTANLIWWALEFWGIGWGTRLAATKWLSELGWMTKGATWGNMIKLANTIERTANASPTLYAMTVDNWLNAAVQYWIDKSIGWKYSDSDFVSNLYLWAALPMAFKAGFAALSSTWRAIKWVTPKDITSLEKAVTKEMETNWAPTPEVALKNINDSFSFEDWKTLGNKVDEYKATTKVNPDAEVSHQEVISTSAKNWVTITTRAGKKVANAINTLNKSLKEGEEVSGAYGTMGSNDSAMMAKQQIVAEVNATPLVKSEDADTIISKVLKENNIAHTEEFKLKDDGADDFDELMHNPESKPELIPEATTLDEVWDAVTWKKSITLSDIEKKRFDIETMNKWGAKSVKELADLAWVKFDWDKAAIDWVTDKDYLHKIVDSIETKVSWYDSFSTRLKKWLNARIKTLNDNIKSWTKIDLIWLGKVATSHISTIQKEIGILTKRLSTATSQAVKDWIEKTILLKNTQIEWIRASHQEYKNNTRIIRQLVRNELDEWATTYSMINPSNTTAIKNKYKAMISQSTTLDRAQKIIESFHKEAYIKWVSALEDKANKLIKSVNRRNNIKKLKSNIPVDTFNKLQEVFNDFNKAKANWDLIKMNEAVNNLSTFYKEGRDIFKAKLVETKAKTQLAVTKMVDVIESRGDTELDMRLWNSPEAWLKTSPSAWERTLKYVESVVPANLQIERLFKWMPEMIDTFLWRFQKIESAFTNRRRAVVDILVPKLIKLSQRIEPLHDNASVKLSLWLTSKTEFGHENNMMTDLIMKKNKAWKYSIIFTNDNVKYLERNKWLVDSWDVVHFWTNDKDLLKEKILNGIYSEFDSHLTNDKEFAAAIWELRTHFTTTWQNIKDISKKRFNKDWDFLKEYFPIIKTWPTALDSAFETSWEYSKLIDNTINDQFLIERVPPSPWKMIRRELWFSEIMSHHLDSAVWWEHTVEALLDADATLRKMAQWRNWLKEIEPIDSKNMFNMEHLTLDDWWDIWIGNQIMSDEVKFFLRTHIGKIATRGRNLAWGFDSWRGIVNSLNTYANRIILSSPYTALKQTASIPDIAIQAWGKNFVSWMRSLTFSNAWLAVQESWKLMERQATKFSREWVWRWEWLTAGDWIFTTTWKFIWEWLDKFNWNSVKLIDWAVSAHAWLAWVSKYLDENNLFHKSWGKLDLASIKEKILAMDWGEEIWKQAIREWDNTMSRVMWSNQITEKSLGSNSALTKWVLLFQRTWLNRVIASLDTAINAYQSWDTLAKRTWLAALQMAKLTIAGAWVYADFKAVQLVHNKVDVSIGKKTEEDTKKIYQMWWWWIQEVQNPTNLDLVWNEMKFFFNANLVSPNTWLDLTVWVTPFLQQISKVSSAPTTERKVEETANAIAKLAMNTSWEELLRFAFAQQWIWMTTVNSKTYDAAATAINSEYKVQGIDATKLPNYEDLVSKKIQIQKAQAEKAKAEKPYKDAEAKLIKDSLQKYWSKPTIEDVIKEYKANSGNLKQITKVKDIKSLYAKVQLAWAKTDGQKESILMGLPADIMYEVEIKPLIVNWDETAAKEKIKELLSKWVIKNAKWVIQMMKYIIIDRNAK